MFMSSSSDKPHPRDLELKWIGKGTPTPLSQKMVIGGVKGFKWLFMETPSAGEWYILMQKAWQCLYIIYIPMSLCRYRKLKQ